jgi:hypothetical protein
MVYENRVLRGAFGSYRDEVTGSWRGLLNEKLHNLYSSPNKTHLREKRNTYDVGGKARRKENTRKNKT